MPRLTKVAQARKLLESLKWRQKDSWKEKIESAEFRSGLGDSAWLLYGICRSLKPSIAVEIGSARGKSACFIGAALKENGVGHLYAIDPHTSTNWNDYESVDTYEVMQSHLGKWGVADVVTIIREHSKAGLPLVPKPIDLIFIDGDHSYKGVEADWELALPYMSSFGVIVFHDTLWDIEQRSEWYRTDMGVPKFVEEIRNRGYPVITIDRDCGVSIVQARQGGVPLSPTGSFR